MKFVNIQTETSVNKVELNIKKEAEYYSTGDGKFTEWSTKKRHQKQTGIHTSYDENTKKICAYYEDGKEHKHFFVPITEVFTGKVKEQNGMTYIKGRTNLSPIFSIPMILAFVVLVVLYECLNPYRDIVAIIFIALIVYFLYIKKTYRDFVHRIDIYLNACAYSNKKTKKNNPNKKKGKWSGKHY